ncbi:MAG TPA: FG-GAP-like repeat-containing protein [Bacteroidia bacterium]
MKKIFSLCLLCAAALLNVKPVHAQAPTTAAGSVITTGQTTSTISISWTSGNGSKRIVTCTPFGNSVSLPSNSSTYTASSTYGSGTNLGNSNYCVYNNTGTGFTVFGLTSGSRYTFRIYEYNTVSSFEYYLTSSYPLYSEYVLSTAPSSQVSALNVSGISTTSASLTWTAGSGTGSLIAVRNTSTASNTPVDGTDYASSSAYGSGDYLTGTSPYPYVVYDGSGTSVSVSGLTAGQTYTAQGYSFNGSSGSNNYYTSSYPSKTFTTMASQPSSASSSVSFSNITDVSMTVSWTVPSSGGGSYRIVTCKPGTTNTDLPADANYYIPGAVYGTGATVGSAYVIYNGTGNHVNVTGLSNTTTYCFSVFEYNVSTNTYNNTYNYLTSSYGTSYQQTLATEPTVTPSALTFSNITSNSFQATWANGNGARRVVGVANGRKQTGLAFDGSNDLLSIPNESSFDFTSDMTVEAWIKVNAFTTADQSVITKGTDSWRITRNGSTNALKFSISSTVLLLGTQTYSVAGTRSVNDGKWHHVAATYDGNQLILYIDGNVDAYYSVNADIDNSSAPVYIGANAMAAGNNFNGQMDEVRIWSYALNNSYIRSNMNRTLMGNEFGLRGYWKLDDGYTATSTARNSTLSTGFDGTLSGFASSAPASSFTGTSGWIHSGAKVNVPLDFVTYLENQAFMSNPGSGYYYGNLYYSVYRGPDSTTINVTNLSPSSYYTIGVFDYNGTLNNNNYLTDMYAIGEVLTASATAPVITSFSPAAGTTGTIVTINGTGFNPVTSLNTVYFGATKAVVLSANAGGTQLTVQAPLGATYEPLSVTNNSLTAFSQKPFIVTSSCGGVAFSTSTFSPAVAFTGLYNYPADQVFADMDNDGKSDVVSTYTGYYMSVARNTTASNTSAITFAAPTYLYNATAPANSDIVTADFDGDGRLDIAMNNRYGSTTTVMTFRNTSSVASISFGTMTEFAATSVTTITDIAAADFDKDGKTDLIVSYNNNTLSYFRNTSSIGMISFAAKTDIAIGASSVINTIATGDLDGDGKVDVAIACGAGNNITYLRNTSTTGSISFAAYISTALGAATEGLAIGDIDTDGKMDIVFGYGTSSLAELKNNSAPGSISFAATPTYITSLANTITDVALGDIDGDGKADIAAGYSSGSQVSLFKNNSASGTASIAAKVDFTIASSYTGPAQVTLGDLNGDSKSDLFSVTSSAAYSLLQNNIDPLVSEPTSSAVISGFTGVTTSSITCNWGAGNGANKVVFARLATSPAFTPFDGVNYIPSANFGTGTDLGGGNYCVFNGNALAVTVTGLASNTAYVLSVYEYNGADPCEFNYIGNSSSNSATQSTNNTPPVLSAISSPASICQSSGLQTVNLAGIGSGSGSELQTLSITATSSNTGLIPNPAVSYTSPATTGSVSYTPVAGASGTAVITVTVNDGATNNNTVVRQFTVTVDHTPTTSNAGPNQQICPGVATLAANTPAYGTGNWIINYTSNPAIAITDLNDPTSTIYGFNIGDSVRLRWVISNGACPNSGTFVSIKRKSCPTTADFTASSTVECLNGTPAVTFTDASISSGSTINSWSWSFGAGASPATANTQGPHTVLYSTAGPKHVSLTVTDLLSANDNETKFSFVNITDVPDPATNISGSSTVCQGQSAVNYTVPAIANATGYTWNLPSGATLISGVNTNSIMVNYSSSAVSGNISVRGTNSCGNGALSASFAVTVDPLPAAAGAIVPSSTYICDGAAGIVFSVPAITNATSYSWTLPGGATIIGATNTNSVTVNFTPGLTGGMITVKGVNSCGNGTSSSLNFIINPYPGAADAIAGPASITSCPSTSGVTYTIPLVSDASSYNWTVPAGAAIVAGAGTNSITVDFTPSAVSGDVTVMPVNTCGNGVASSHSITVNTLPEAAGSINGADTVTVCPVSGAVVYSVPSVFNADNYIWSVPAGASIISGDSTNSITVNFSNTASSGNITVYGENACGNGMGSVFEVVVNSVPGQDLCMVSVDNNSNYNTITWEKPAVMDIDSFRIYREVLSSFVNIGAVDYDDLSAYVDSIYLPAADPNTTNFRYKISVIDTCGNESMLSSHHRTIFLQANQGVGGVVNLNWVPYEGATVDFYRILRDTLGSGPFVAIDSVPGANTVYTDLSPPGTLNVRYLLESNWPVSCSPTRATVNTTRSNIKNVGLIITDIEQTIMNSGINVYPNPADDMITVEYPAGFKKYSMEVYDAVGQLVISEELNDNNSGTGILSHTVDVSMLTKGIYIVNIRTEYGSTFKRLVIQ